MAQDTRREFLSAPPNLVFDYIVDVKRHIEWSGAVELGLHRIEVLTNGPVGPGTRWQSDGRNFTGELNHDESTVTAFDPPHRFGFDTQFALKGAKLTFSHRYDLAAENGGTRLVYSLVKAKPRNLIGALFILYVATVKRATAKRVVSNGFEALKAAVERMASEEATMSREPGASNS